MKPREVHAKGPTAEGLRMMTPRFAMQALQREIMISAWVKIVVPFLHGGFFRVCVVRL